MRVALVVAALVVALVAGESESRRDSIASRRPIDLAPSFRASHEYQYEWDSQLATTIGGSTQHAVQRMRAQIRLIFTSEKSAVVQMKKIESWRLNDHTHVSPTHLLPTRALQKVEMPPRHIDTLEKPFEISYERGRITDITFETDDQVWSENVKRAVMSSLSVHMEEDETVSNYRANETTIEGICESIYTIVPSQRCGALERRRGGEQRGFEQREMEADCVQVTKSIDFKRCSHRPDLRYNFFRGEQLTTRQGYEPNRRAQPTLATSTFGQAELAAQNGGRPLIRFARTISQYTQPLVDEASLNAVAVVEMKLKHSKAQSSNSKTPSLNSRTSAQMLAHSLDFDVARERFMGQGDEEVHKQQPFLVERNVLDVVINLIKKLMQSFVLEPAESSRIDWEGAQNFVYLVKTLRHANATELREMERRLLGEDVEQKERREKNKPRDLPKGSEWLKSREEIVEQMLVDAYAAAATEPTIKRLYERVVEYISRQPKRQLNEVDDRRVAETLQKVARSVPVVSPEVVTETWKLCANFAPRTDAQRSCVLVYTRLAHVLCARRNGIPTNDDSRPVDRSMRVGDEYTTNKRYYVDSAFCTGAIRSELSENIRKLLDNDKDDTEQRVLALKAYGNLGLDTTLISLESVITDRTRPRLERTLAIDALRNIASSGVAHKVRRLLTPIFVDKRELPEVRMAALQQLLVARPDKSTIDQIGTAAIREPNVNVRAFTATALRNAAKIVALVDPQVARSMMTTSQLSRLSGAEATMMTRRATSRWAAWSLMPQADTFIRAASLVSNDSRLPKELWAALDVAFSGHFEPLFAQFGMQQQNLESLISHVLERFGDQSADAQLFVRREPRSTIGKAMKAPIDTLKSMYDRVQHTVRSYLGKSNSDEQPTLIVYRREANMDVWYSLYDQKNMPAPLRDLVTDGQIDMSAAETDGARSIRWTDASLLADQMVKTPTIAGVPLVYTLHVAKVTAMNGEWSLEMGSRAAGGAVDGGVDHVRGLFRAVPKMSLRSMFQFEVWSPIHNTGVRVLHTLDAQTPMNVKAEYTVGKGLQLDWQLPDTMTNGAPHRLLHAASHAATTYRAWPERSRVYLEPEEHTIFLPQLDSAFMPMQREWRDPLSGVRIETRGHIHASRSPLALMVGENVVDLHMHVEPRAAAKTMRLALSATSKRLDDAERKQLPTARHLMRVFEHQDRARTLFASADAERHALRERLARTEMHAGRVSDIELRVQALEQSQNQPRAEIHAHLQTICDQSGVMCSTNATARAQLAGAEWMASAIAHRADFTMSQIYGSVRSEHMLAHAEAQFGSQPANTLTACIYARPSPSDVRRWHSFKDAAVSQQQQSMEDDEQEMEERENWAFTQTPAMLDATRMTAVVEHQLAPATQRLLRPIVGYVQTMLSPKRSFLAQLLAQSPVDSQDEQTKLREHGVTKIDATVEDRALRVSINDATNYMHRMPAFDAASLVDLVDTDRSNDDYERRQPSKRRGSSFFGFFDDDQQDEQIEKDDQTEQRRDEKPRRQDSYDLDVPQTRRSSHSTRPFHRRDNHRFAQCVINSNFDVRSFEGKHHKITPSSCWTVLSKGCGSSSSEFAVYAKKAEGEQTLKVKLVVPRHTFVLYENKGEMVIELNDKRLDESEFEKYWIHKITETGKDLYVLHCRFNGMELRFDGRRAAIKMSDSQLNEQCGVCDDKQRDGDDEDEYLDRGDQQSTECSPMKQRKFDDMDEDESEISRRSKFQRGSKKQPRESDELLDQMQSKSDRMGDEHRDEKRADKKGDRKLKSRSDWEQSHEQSEERDSDYESEFEQIEPRKQTIMHEQSDIICFSTQPFKTCPRGTAPVQRRTDDNKQKAEMPFVCMERDADANRLKRQVREQRVVDMSSYKSNKMLPVFEPVKCTRQNVYSESAYFI